MVGEDAPDPFPAPLKEFVRLFNAGQFWESHEALEGPWREGGSAFYHGLILFASAFVHVGRKNAHGIRAQLEKAERALAPYDPHHLGVDVAGILECCRRVRGAVAEVASGPSEAGSDAVEAVEFTLDPGLVRGDEPELGQNTERFT